jgi:hypothetical protein
MAAMRTGEGEEEREGAGVETGFGRIVGSPGIAGGEGIGEGVGRGLEEGAEVVGERCS